ncbi:MAG: tRNA lysidine(34) synthetase TilS, partial [Agathobacter sp.]|nr:tRNA lysidine(34) synthetase TilS [Agathobacter sp.]
VTLPYQLVAVRQNDEILIYKKAQTDTEEMRFEVTVSKEILKTLMESKDSISINLLEGRGSLELQVFDSIQAADIISKKTYTKTFDYDMIKSGFTVRNRREGDFLIVDEDGHKKKLKQYFINEKIPVLKRNETILLTKGSEVFWVIGKRIGENYKVRQDSRRFLRVIYYGG